MLVEPDTRRRTGEGKMGGWPHPTTVSDSKRSATEECILDMHNPAKGCV
jgi:hypothetical protein